MLTAIAIDDEPNALEVVEMLASKVPFLQLKACFTDAFEAIPYLQKNKIDLIFLDINMPDISGIEFVKSLQKAPMIIFTTAYSEYAVQGFDLDAVDYLLKPFSLTRFLKACNKALESKMLQNDEINNDFIFIKTGYEEEKVMLNDISYIEADGNYLIFMLTNKKLLSRLSMSDILKILPENQFIRIHRSYIIALDKIEKMSRQDIMIGGNKIPVGASYEYKIIEIRQKLTGK